MSSYIVLMMLLTASFHAGAAEIDVDYWVQNPPGACSSALDDTCAIQYAADLLGDGDVLLFTGESYVISTRIEIDGTSGDHLTDIVIEGNGATLTQVDQETSPDYYRALHLEYVENVTVRDLHLVGADNFANGTKTAEAGIFIYYCDGVSVYNTLIEEFGYSGINWQYSENIMLEGNTIRGPSGISGGNNENFCLNSYVSSDYDNVTIAGNLLDGCAQGIYMDEISNVVIANNRITNIAGQHAMYLHVSDATIVGNVIGGTQRSGIKLQVGSSQSDDMVNVVVEGNVISDASTGAIVVEDNHATYSAVDVSVVGNYVGVTSGSVDYGVYCDGCLNASIKDNLIYGTEAYGIFLSQGYGSIQDNRIVESGWSSIYFASTLSQPTTIAGNTIVDPVRGTGMGNEYQKVGIYVGSSGVATLTNNEISLGVLAGDLECSLRATASTDVAAVGNYFTDAVDVEIEGDVSLLEGNHWGELTGYTPTSTAVLGRGIGADYHANTKPASCTGYDEGDRVWNADPEPDEYLGWICVDNGTNLVFKGFGLIED